MKANNMRGRAQPRWAYIPNVSDDKTDVLRKIEVIDKGAQTESIDGIEGLAVSD